MKHIVPALCLSILAACIQSEAERERACYDKLTADFEASRAFGREQASAAPMASQEAVSWSEYALAAAESAVTISVIHLDDDQSACDYVSDGPYLKRK